MFIVGLVQCAHPVALVGFAGLFSIPSLHRPVATLVLGSSQIFCQCFGFHFGVEQEFDSAPYSPVRPSFGWDGTGRQDPVSLRVRTGRVSP